MQKRIFLVLCSLFSILTLQAQTIDTKNSYIQFEVKNMGKVVEGTMKNMKGQVQIDPNDLAKATFEATVAPNTVHTGSKGRDNHLHKDDFFGVEQYEVIKMVSKEIKKTDKGYEATALLTIRDIETEVVIPFTIEQKEDRQILVGKLDLLRKEYGLGTAISKMMIGLDVQVTIHAELL
ncbi:MAG: YceI family protein [Aureispira sp.]